MRIQVLLFLTFISTALFAQTEHDSLLFERINNFRLEQGVEALVWDSCMYLAAKHQSDYMCSRGKVTHTQIPYSRIQNWNEEYNTRISHFCPQLPKHFISAENVGPAFLHSLEEMSWAIEMHFNGWKNSKGHRNNLLFNEGNEHSYMTPKAAVAISCQCKSDPEYLKRCYATFVVRK